jgi:hypothetical protein
VLIKAAKWVKEKSLTIAGLMLSVFLSSTPPPPPTHTDWWRR